jgi:hypothetical protein
VKEKKLNAISQNSFELKSNKDPIFYFRGFRRWNARDNGMKLLNFRYSGICSSRSCAENRAGLRNLPIKVFGMSMDPKNFYCPAYGGTRCDVSANSWRKPSPIF